MSKNTTWIIKTTAAVVAAIIISEASGMNWWQTGLLWFALDAMTMSDGEKK